MVATKCKEKINFHARLSKICDSCIETIFNANATKNTNGANRFLNFASFAAFALFALRVITNFVEGFIGFFTKTSKNLYEMSNLFLYTCPIIVT